jgi:hypothetical protein
VFEPEKTIGAKKLEDLKLIKFGVAGWPTVPAYVTGAMGLANMTYCSYNAPFTEEYVPCNGTEDVSFHPTNVGIQEVQPRLSLSTPNKAL